MGLRRPRSLPARLSRTLPLLLIPACALFARAQSAPPTDIVFKGATVMTATLAGAMQDGWNTSLTELAPFPGRLRRSSTLRWGPTLEMDVIGRHGEQLSPDPGDCGPG